MKFKQANDYALLQTKLMYSNKHNLMTAMVNRYLALPRSTTAETALAEYVFDAPEQQALVILSVCTISGKKAPIASLIGMIASALLQKDLDQGKVIATYTAVAEFIVASPEIFPQHTAFFGGKKVESIFYSVEEAEKKLFQLPSFEGPTKAHRNLGKFRWTAATKDAVDKLNRVPLIVLDFEETTVPPAGSEDRVKYDIRSAIRPVLAKNETAMHFNWNMDYRGRMYASGYHLGVQGNEYEKNIMAFKNDYTCKNMDEFRISELEIMKAIAVAFGKNKLIDDEKLAWFESNEDSLDWTTAKEPTYARAQLKSLELLRATDSTNIPVELDSTCSQRQMIAVLTGDLKTATTCNIVTDNSYIQDAYGLVAKEMSRISGLKFNRDQIKASDMISGYGAGEKRVTEQLIKDLKEYYYDGVAQVFFDASNHVDPMASAIKQTFQSLWDDSRTHWSWTLPDGFQVTYITEEARTITVNPFGTGNIDVIAHMIIPTSKNTGLGVNIIHSVDAYVCRQMVVRCPFDIITIHDGFRCLPHNAPAMRRIYNEIMGEIVDRTLLEDIIKEISGVEITLNKQFSSKHVSESMYSIS